MDEWSRAFRSSGRTGHGGLGRFCFGFPTETELKPSFGFWRWLLGRYKGCLELGRRNGDRVSGYADVKSAKRHAKRKEMQWERSSTS